MPVRTRTEGVCRTLKNICTVNARIGLNLVMFQNIMNITTCQRVSTEAEHSTNCIPDRSKVIFSDVVKELLGETPAKHFLGTDRMLDTVLPGIVLTASSSLHESCRRPVESPKLRAGCGATSKHSSTLRSNGTMRKNNNADFSKRLESLCPKVSLELLEIREYTSYAYIMDGMDMVQSERSSSTSWKRILGIEQCDHCLRPIWQWSINQDTRETATWFILFADTTPMYQILGSRPVPNYRKFSERNMQQGEPNQLYLKLHRGE